MDGGLIRFYGMPFPTRMVVVRLPEGGLWLHSPTRWGATLGARLAALGRVHWLVAPNPIHYAFLPGWAAAHPEAAVFAAPGVARRAASRKVAFPAHEVLSDMAPRCWRGTIDQRLIPGHPFLKEVVFFHRPSATLILTDLIENFEAAKVSLPMRMAAWLGGILAPEGGTPRDIRLTWRDRDAAREALREVIGWRPRKIVMAHGRIVGAEAGARLERAFAWLL